MEGAPLPVEIACVTALQGEVVAGRRKFPANRLLLAALMEEVGELARALLQRQGRVQVEREALQVAAVAMRIFEEGDATFADVSDEEAQP
jgi:hypothetical protein